MNDPAINPVPGTSPPPAPAPIPPPPSPSAPYPQSAGSFHRTIAPIPRPAPAPPASAPTSDPHPPPSAGNNDLLASILEGRPPTAPQSPPAPATAPASTPTPEPTQNHRTFVVTPPAPRPAPSLDSLPPASTPPVAHQSDASALQRAEQALEEAAGHLESAADHLESVADQLASLAKPVAAPMASPAPSPPLSVPAAPVIPGAPSVAAGPATSNLSVQLAIPSTLFAIVALLLVLLESLQLHNKTLTWMTLLTMNVVGTVGFNVMLRFSAWKKVDQWVTATVLQTGLALPWIVKEVVSPIHFNKPYTPFYMAVLALGITLLMVLQFCNVKALQHLEASVFAVIFNSRIIIATIFGTFFLGEFVGLWALLGGILIFAAIFIVKQKSTTAITTQGVMYGLAAAGAMSLMNTCEKELITHVGYQQYVFPMWTIAAVIMWGIVLARRMQVPYGLLLKPQGLVIMTLRAFAGLGFTAALIYGSVAVSSYVSSLSVILTIVVGLLFLGERDYLRSKLIAAGVAVAGLTFILIDRLR